MRQPLSYNIKCPRIPITMHQIDVVAKFLREQPRYNPKLRKEPYVLKHYNNEPGQHYLWKASSQATDWKDFCTKWGTSEDPYWIKTDRPHLIMPGEPFLVDIVGGELWICYENAAGKPFKVAQVSNDMNRDYGNCFNGYALMPQCFWDAAPAEPVRGVS